MERYAREHAAASLQQQYFMMPDRRSHGAAFDTGVGLPFGGAHGAGGANFSSHGGYCPPSSHLAPLQVLPLAAPCLPPYYALPAPRIPFQAPPPQPVHPSRLPPLLPLPVPPLATSFQPSGAMPRTGPPFISPQPFYTGPGTVKVEEPRPGMWLPVQESRKNDARVVYPVHVKPEPGLPVVKEEVKLENDYLYEEDNLSWNGDEEEEAEDLALSSHICESMIIHGDCRCNNSSTSAQTALPRPPLLDLKSLGVLNEPEVIDLSSGGCTPISIGSSPSSSPPRTASEQLSDLLSASQARDERLAALGKAIGCVPKTEPEDLTLLCLPAPEVRQPGLDGAIVPVSTEHIQNATPANGISPTSQPSRSRNKRLVSPTVTEKPSAGCQVRSSRKRKEDSRNEVVPSNVSQLDQLISLGKVDSAIRLPKLELDGIAVQDPHRENVMAIRDSFDRLRVAIQRECQEHTLPLRRPDLKAASVLRQKGLWLNFSNVVGAVKGVCVGDAFPFRITLCVLGLHRHIRAGIGYVPEKDSVYKMSFATSVVIGKDKVYKDDIDNGETVVYTGQGGLVNTKDQRLQGATATDQKLVRGNLALDNSYKLKIPIRVMRGHHCIGSPSGVLYTYDGLYMIADVKYESGLDDRKVYKFVLHRMEDQEPLVPFDANATPLQAVPSASKASLLLANS